MRRRYRQLQDNTLEEIIDDRVIQPKVVIRGEIPDYVSPVTGKLVSGRRQRRYDLESTGCRPHEGREQERKEADRIRNYSDQTLERGVEAAVMRSAHQLPFEHRKLLGI